QPRITSLLATAGRRGAPAGLLLGGCWLAAQVYPPIPIFSLGHLRPAWGHFLATPISPVEVLAAAAGWFVFSLAVLAVWGRIGPGALALAMLAVPFRLFLPDRVV